MRLYCFLYIKIGNAAKMENIQISTIAWIDLFLSIFFRMVHTMPLNRSKDMTHKVDIAAIKHITLKTKFKKKIKLIIKLSNLYLEQKC